MILADGDEAVVVLLRPLVQLAHLLQVHIQNKRRLLVLDIDLRSAVYHVLNLKRVDSEAVLLDELLVIEYSDADLLNSVLLLEADHA